MIDILGPPGPGIKLEDLWYILAQLLVLNLILLVINIIVLLMLFWKLDKSSNHALKTKLTKDD